MREHTAVVASASVVFLALLACGDPVYSIEGTVTDATGTPLVGATVKKTCPSSSPETSVTDGVGHFRFGGIGGSFDSDKCSLVIDKAGFTTQTIPSLSACLRSTKRGNTGKPCGAAEGKITLVR